MTGCLDDRSLVMVRYAEASPAEQEHVRTCLRCAARYQRLSHDLERIGEVLGGRPPAIGYVPAAAAASWRRVLAAGLIAVVVLLGGVEMWMWKASTSMTGGQGDTDMRTLLGEVAAVLGPSDDADAPSGFGPAVSTDGDHEALATGLGLLGDGEEQ